jgi:hypothetical protein
MKKIFILSFVTFCFGFIGLVLWAGRSYAQPPGCSPIAQNLGMCQDNLAVCEDDLAQCEADFQIFPGDGYTDPSYDTIGHGPALSYTDNGDGTFTDNNTGYMWEIKDNNNGVHDVDNTYTWSTGTPWNADGTLFTNFLFTLNNTCQNDETVDCSTNGDADCVEVGGSCGFAGFRDWCIPNVKKLQSIVDYTMVDPATSVPGLTTAYFYWSSTSAGGGSDADSAWVVELYFGGVYNNSKNYPLSARAVRPCP